MLTKKTLQNQLTIDDLKAYRKASEYLSALDRQAGIEEEEEEKKKTKYDKYIGSNIHTAGDIFKLATAEFLGETLEGATAGLIPDSITNVVWQPQTAKEKAIKTIAGIAGNIAGTIAGLVGIGKVLQFARVPALVSRAIRAEKLVDFLEGASGSSKIAKSLIGDASKLVHQGLHNALTFGTYRGISEIQTDKPFTKKLEDVVEDAVFGFPFARVSQIEKWYKGLPASFTLFATDSILRDLRTPPEQRGNLWQNALVNGLIGAGLETIGRVKFRGRVEPIKSVKDMSEEVYKRAQEIANEPLEVREERLIKAKEFDEGVKKVEEKPVEVKPEIEEEKPREVKIEGIPKELEPLAREARKYKSAEEFADRFFDDFGREDIFRFDDWMQENYPEYRKIVKEWSLEREIKTEVEGREYWKISKKIEKLQKKALKDFYNQAVKGIKEIKPETEAKIPVVEEKRLRIDPDRIVSTIETEKVSLPPERLKEIKTYLKRTKGFIPNEAGIIKEIKSKETDPFEIVEKIVETPSFILEDIDALGKLLPAVKTQAKKTIEQFRRIQEAGNSVYDEIIESQKKVLEKTELEREKEKLSQSIERVNSVKEEFNQMIEKAIEKLKRIVDYQPKKVEINKKALDEILNNIWLKSEKKTLDDLYLALSGEKTFDPAKELEIKRKADEKAREIGFKNTKDLYNAIFEAYPELRGTIDGYELAENVVKDMEAQKIKDELETSGYRLPILKKGEKAEILASDKPENPEKVNEIVKNKHIYFETQKMLNKLGISVKKGRLENPLALAKSEDGAIKVMGYLRTEIIPHEIFHIKNTLGAEKLFNDILKEKPEIGNAILKEMDEVLSKKFEGFERLPIDEKLTYLFETWFNSRSDTFRRILPRSSAFIEKVMADIKEADPMVYQTIMDVRGFNLAFNQLPAALKADASIVSRDNEKLREKYLTGSKDVGLIKQIYNDLTELFYKETNIYKFADELEKAAYEKEGKYINPKTGKFDKELLIEEKMPVSEIARMVPNLTNSLSLWFYEKGIPNPEFYKAFFEGKGDISRFLQKGKEQTGFAGILQKLFGLDEYTLSDEAFLYKGGLKDILAPVYEKGLEHHLKTYLAALEYEKRYRIAEERGEGIPPAPPGFGKNEIQEVLETKRRILEGEGIDVDEIVAELSKFRKALLNFARETGALPEETIEKFLQEEFHFPLLRARGLGMPEAKTSLFHKWVGSEAPILDPIDTYLNEVEYIGRKSVENLLLRRLADTIGNKKVVFRKEYAEVIEKPYSKMELEIDTEEKINEILENVKALNKNIDEIELERIKYDLKKYPEFVNQLWRDIRFGIRNNTIFPVRMEDGTIKYIKLSKNLADAMNLLRTEVLDTALFRLIQGFTSLKRSFLTTYSLPFALTNVFRDQITQFYLANRSNIPGVGLIKGFSKALSETDAHKQLADLFGLEWNTFSKMARLDNLSKEGKIEDGVRGVAKKALKTLETISSTSEFSSRLGVFANYDPTNIAEIRRGLIDGRNATFFWGQRGRKAGFTATWNKFSAFFRAGVNASYQTFGTIKNHPIRTLVRTSPILGLTVLEIIMHRNDKDWQQLPFWRHFISVNLGKVGNHWLFIPMNEFFYSAPHATMIALYKWLSGQSSFDADRFLLQLADTVSPFGLSNITPDIVKVAGELFAPEAFNTDLFTGREIVPEWMKEFPAKEQYTAYTSDAIVALTDILNKISGEKAQLSPMRVQHFIDTNLGAMGRYFEAASDLMIDTIGKRIGFDPNEIREGDAFKDLMTFSGLNRFIHDKYSPTVEADVMKFMDTYRRLRGVQRLLENYKNYHPKQYLEMANKYMAEYNAYNVLSGYYKAIRNLVKTYRAIEKSDLPEKEKEVLLEEIKGRIRIIASTANEAYSTYLKDRDVKIK